MDNAWNNSTRFGAIHQALNQMPHDQVALGLGFKLSHNPSNCTRCRAYIATLELDGLMKMLENKELESSEGEAVEVGTNNDN